MKYGKRDIYSKRQERALKVINSVDDSSTTETNKELIKKFQKYLYSTGSKDIRIAKLTQQLLTTLKFSNFEMKDVDKDQIIDVISSINRRDTYQMKIYSGRRGSKQEYRFVERTYSESTKADYRRTVKQFFSWYKDEDNRLDSNEHEERRLAMKFYNYIENKVHSNVKLNEPDPSTILTDKDIKVVLEKGCNSIRDKALIRFLHETGVRAGELLNMRWKDITVHDTYAEVVVDGKTGIRPVQLTKSKCLLAKLRNDSLEGSDDAYVWIGESVNRLRKPLSHIGTSQVVQRCFKRARVTKRHNLHWFRHSRATINGQFWTEPIMRLYFGWSKTSKQPQRYCHTSKKQVVNAFQSFNGLLSNEEETKNEAITCGCGQINDNISRYCERCGNALKVNYLLDDQMKVKEQLRVTFDKMVKLLGNPEDKQSFERFKKLMAST